MRHMLRKLPLMALVLAAVAMFAPTAAQAHTVTKGTAKCEIVGGKPTITGTYQLEKFGGQKAVDTTKGTIWIDGVAVRNVKSSDIKWEWREDDKGDSYAYGVYSFTAASDGGEHNVKARFEWNYEDGKVDYGPKAPDDVTTVTCPPAPKPPVDAKPSIDLDKSGPATAAAGSKVTYNFKATNTGNVKLDNVVLKDAKCESPITRVAPNESDSSFDPKDSWYFSCTVTAPAGPATVDNTAEVCSEYRPTDGGTVQRNICDSDKHSFTVSAGPSTPTPTPTPVTPTPTPSPVTPTPQKSGGTGGGKPGGGVKPTEVVSGRASLRGPSGCVKKPFRASVNGRNMKSVTWYVDGRKVKTDKKARTSYRLAVTPSKLGYGRHRILARVQFKRESGSKARRLPLTFRRCASGSTAPRFVG